MRSSYISRRIYSAKSSTFASVIHRIAVASIGIGLAIMIVSFLILRGYQDTIKEKIFSFGGHIQITKYTLNNSFEEAPVQSDREDLERLLLDPYVIHIQEFSHKVGLLKSDDEVLGVVLKGVGENFKKDNIESKLVEGSFITFDSTTASKDILVSRKIADMLNITSGDGVVMTFVQDPPRYRKLHVCGIYDTGLEEFDEKVIIGDIALIQNINNWPDSLAGGFEVFVSDLDKIDQVAESITRTIGFDLRVDKVSDLYRQIFEWLNLLDRNVILFLFLILFVASFNMVSVIFILIMEKTPFIGLLKALGALHSQIRNIFLYHGVFMVIKGLALGNILGIGFCAIQYFFKLIPLNPENYYMDYVPISWEWGIILFLNIFTFLLVMCVLFFPMLAIAKIRPIKAIRFD